MIEDLKKMVESYGEDLKTKSGRVTRFSEAGPVGMNVIDSVVTVLEAHEKRIAALEGREFTQGGL